MEAGYRCGNPRCPVILAVHILQDHHIVHVSEGGGNQLSNLLALCPNCHTLYHHKEITRNSIRHWKGLLLALTDGGRRKEVQGIDFDTEAQQRTGGLKGRCNSRTLARGTRPRRQMSAAGFSTHQGCTAGTMGKGQSGQEIALCFMCSLQVKIQW